MASRLRQRLGCLLAGALACGTLAAAEPYRIAQAAMPPASAPANDAGRVSPPRGSSDEQCRLRWRDYQRSQDCFAPFFTVNGIKPEAFSTCGPALPEPSMDCGPPPREP